MPIFRNGYETTTGSVVSTKSIEKAIQESMIKDSIQFTTLNVKTSDEVIPFFVTGKAQSEADIPLFTHPLLFKRNQQSYLATDLRLYLRKDDIRQGRSVIDSVRNRTEFNFMKSLAVLTTVWINDGVRQLKNSLPFAGVVFANWISETLRKAFALDFQDSMRLSVITHFYYQSLFEEGSSFSEDIKQKWAVHTIKATQAPAKMVFEIFDQITEIRNIEDYLKQITNILENVRLQNLSFASFLTLIGSSWYGTNAKEFIPVSLEHPPTWIAMLCAVLSERTYKSSSIYRIAERFSKRGAGDEFMRNYTDIVNEQLNPDIAVEFHSIVIPDFE